jgi:hypothetical protein
MTFAKLELCQIINSVISFMMDFPSDLLKSAGMVNVCVYVHDNCRNMHRIGCSTGKTDI